MHSADKPLNRMDRLQDMAHFPPIVNAGATANVLMTIAITFYLVPRHPQVYAPMVWLAIVLTLNLLPVVLLRLTLSANTQYRKLGEMNFIHDQHKFSDWVYLAASANMAFWVLAAWAIFSLRHDLTALTILLVTAFLVTFSPVLLRGFTSASR